MLSSEELKEFQKLWKVSFNEEISREFALEQASSLLVLVRNIYKPITKENYEKFRKKI
ncbi:hypothetical protein GYA54_02215 [Candidatus Kuenenbacteria bacterium]|nr:hypothetical protein [Candidatus Kuenenbacteria bacterium]